MTSFDAIVIGGGHNGLTAAAALSKSGRKVVVLEAHEKAGGALRGDSFHPGFQANGPAQIVNRLDPDVAKLLALPDNLAGGRDVPTVVLSARVEPAILESAYGERIRGVSKNEADRFRLLRDTLISQAGILRRFLKRTPPPLKAVGISDLAALGSAGLALLLKGREESRDFLRMLLMNVADIGDEYLTDDRLKALIAFDATLGVQLGPRSPTSLLGLYYRLTGEVNGHVGGQFVPEGGVAALGEAFVAGALKAGVTIRTSAPVARILADRGVVSGVVLESGETFTAPIIVAAIHPKTTFLTLIDAAEIGTGFRRAIGNIRSLGNVARLDLALDTPPSFTGVPQDALTGRLVIGRSMEHVETAFNPSKYGELPADPVMEVMLPSLAQPSLAPSGAATLSALIPFVPYALKEGLKHGRSRLEAAALAVLERHAPGIGRSVRAVRVMAPPDIEAAYHIPGGHWHHGELQADQLLVNRPVHAASRYSTPLQGLFLASAGSHPGGGISGLPGLLAARQILAGDRR
ncbi:phytoene desaturase family protein [Rhizobium sp. SL42]|uniref:phytoene desaturase family protein n=1 Tax=Rhizobium sp. SL42 TaxID=2806346 RepID=UPI001F281B33|nr:NAD(P)/FAD-dependent oxidoreductase [Rhizobium sp. SL42]UJW77114.1 NAD(P)/FAD-dependent oxidoreductase [Rhizobium sp. SL42]